MAKIERKMLRALGLTLFTLCLVGCAGNNSTSLNQPPTGSRYNSNPSGPENSAPVILRSKSKFSAEKTPIKAISLLEPTTSHPGGIAILCSTDKSSTLIIRNFRGEELASKGLDFPALTLAVTSTNQKSAPNIFTIVSKEKPSVSLIQLKGTEKNELELLTTVPLSNELITKEGKVHIFLNPTKDQSIYNLVLNSFLDSQTSAIATFAVDTEKKTIELKSQLNAKLTEKVTPAINANPFGFLIPETNTYIYNSIDSKTKKINLGETKLDPQVYDEVKLAGTTETQWVTINSAPQLACLSTSGPSSLLSFYKLSDPSINRLTFAGSTILPVSAHHPFISSGRPLKDGLANGFFASVNSKDNAVEFFDLAQVLNATQL